jgi:hypothetical protein
MDNDSLEVDESEVRALYDYLGKWLAIRNK